MFSTEVSNVHPVRAMVNVVSKSLPTEGVRSEDPDATAIGVENVNDVDNIASVPDSNISKLTVY